MTFRAHAALTLSSVLAMLSGAASAGIGSYDAVYSDSVDAAAFDLGSSDSADDGVFYSVQKLGTTGLAFDRSELSGAEAAIGGALSSMRSTSTLETGDQGFSFGIGLDARLDSSADQFSTRDTLRATGTYNGSLSLDMAVSAPTQARIDFVIETSDMQGLASLLAQLTLSSSDGEIDLIASVTDAPGVFAISQVVDITNPGMLSLNASIRAHFDSSVGRFTDESGSFSISGGVTIIPAPSSAALLAMTGVLAARRRR